MSIKNFLFGSSITDKFGDIGILIARLGFGLYLSLAHGFAKLPPSEQMVGGLEKMGLPMPMAMAWLAAFAEGIATLFVAVGLLTRPMALMAVVTMGVAAFAAHGNDPWASMGGASKEPAMMYFIGFLAIAFLGGGNLSIDRLIRKSNAQPSEV